VIFRTPRSQMRGDSAVGAHMENKGWA